MRHDFLDRYSDLDSAVHRRDPRTKLLAALGFVLSAVLTPAGEYPVYGAHLALGILALALSRVPFGYVLKRSFTIVPFVLLIGFFLPFMREGEVLARLEFGSVGLSVTDEGLEAFLSLCCRSFLAILALVLLSASTPFPSLLRALRKFHVPQIFVMLLSFMYRYVFLLVDEAERMEMARRSRYFGGAAFRQARVLAGMAALLFVRTYERGERVYESMLSRGFDGEARSLARLRFGAVDWLSLAGTFALLGALRLIG